MATVGEMSKEEFRIKRRRVAAAGETSKGVPSARAGLRAAERRDGRGPRVPAAFGVRLERLRDPHI
jgi:hypothetical protein